MADTRSSEEIRAEIAELEEQIAEGERLRAQRCRCGHRRGRHQEGAGWCWVGFSPPSASEPCPCLGFELAEEES